VGCSIFSAIQSVQSYTDQIRASQTIISGETFHCVKCECHTKVGYFNLSNNLHLSRLLMMLLSCFSCFLHECFWLGLVGSKNLGRFYKFVNARLANKQGVGTLKNRGGQAVTNDMDRANLLNEYFCSVSVPDNGIVPNFSDKSGSGKLDSVVFSRNVVIKAIKKLKPNLSAGPDGYPPVFIRKLVNTISEPLALIYNAFMSVGQVPDMWWRAIVTPVYKSGAAYDVSNYRPISLTCVFCKVMERVIESEMSDYLRQKGLINKHQHGFCPDDLQLLTYWKPLMIGH